MDVGIGIGVGIFVIVVAAFIYFGVKRAKHAMYTVKQVQAVKASATTEVDKAKKAVKEG